MANKITNSLFLSPVSENEINVILTSLKDCVPGFEDVKPGPLKVVMSQLTKPLIHICNMSLQEGLPPQDIKRANIVTLCKKENIMLLINCTHVALLCTLSKVFQRHYDDVIMTTIASQITSLTTVYPTVYSDTDQRKHQSPASLTFVWGIHRGPVNSPHKWPVTRKMFPFDDVIMNYVWQGNKLLGRVHNTVWMPVWFL